MLLTPLLNKNVSGPQTHASGIHFNFIISQIKNALDWFIM